jgi:hypothetical protein
LGTLKVLGAPRLTFGLRLGSASHSRKHNETRDNDEDDYKVAFAHFQSFPSRGHLTGWLHLGAFKIVSDKALQSQDQTATGLGPNGDKNSTNSQRFLRI